MPLYPKLLPWAARLGTVATVLSNGAVMGTCLAVGGGAARLLGLRGGVFGGLFGDFFLRRLRPVRPVRPVQLGGLLAGPPVFGFVAQGFGLQMALACSVANSHRFRIAEA